MINKKNITKILKELIDDNSKQWKNALDLLDAAFEQGETALPTPDQDEWEDYEDLIVVAVNALADAKGKNGTWRTTIPIEESVLPKFTVTIDGALIETIEAKSLVDAELRIAARYGTGHNISISLVDLVETVDIEPNSLPAEWTLNPDTGRIDVNGDVEREQFREWMFQVEFGNISGFFDCSDLNLVSLRRASPTHVGTYFYCNNNKLTSLEDGPQDVTLGYFCGSNPLQNFKGAPAKLLKNFHAVTNTLTSIEGMPACNICFISSEFIEKLPSNDLIQLVKAPILRFNCSLNQGNYHTHERAAKIIELVNKHLPSKDALLLQDELLAAGLI